MWPQIHLEGPGAGIPVGHQDSIRYCPYMGLAFCSSSCWSLHSSPRGSPSDILGLKERFSEGADIKIPLRFKSLMSYRSQYPSSCNTTCWAPMASTEGRSSSKSLRLCSPHQAVIVHLQFFPLHIQLTQQRLFLPWAMLPGDLADITSFIRLPREKI